MPLMFQTLQNITGPLLPQMLIDIDRHPDRIFSDHVIDYLEDANISANASELLTAKYSLKISFIIVLRQGLSLILNIPVGVILVK